MRRVFSLCQPKTPLKERFNGGQRSSSILLGQIPVSFASLDVVFYWDGCSPHIVVPRLPTHCSTLLGVLNTVCILSPISPSVFLGILPCREFRLTGTILMRQSMQACPLRSVPENPSCRRGMFRFILTDGWDLLFNLPPLLLGRSKILAFLIKGKS